ncbi:MAG: MFS transporter [Alphaproteobacteria bacterium]|nr:MFS transporter [Alphaproteobacteria bacterium]
MSPALAAGEPLAPVHWQVLLWDRFVSGLRIGIIFPLVIAWAELHGVAADRMGLIYACGGLGSVLSSLVCAHAAHRWGKRLVMAASSLVAVIGWCLIGVSQSLAVMCCAQIMAGAGLSAAIILNDAYVGAHAPVKSRSRYFAFALAFRGLGIASGAVLFGWLKSIALMVLIVISALALTYALIAAFLPESELPLIEPEMQERVAQEVPVTVWRKARAGVAIWVLFFLAEAFVGRYVPIHAQDYWHASDTLMTVIFSSMGLTMVAAPVIIQGTGRWLKDWHMLVGGLLFTGAGALFCARAPSALLLAVGFIVWGLVWDVVSPFITSFISRSVAATEQTQVMALQQMGTAFATLTGPVLAGWLYGQVADGLFALAACIFAFAALLGFACRHRPGLTA